MSGYINFLIKNELRIVYSGFFIFFVFVLPLSPFSDKKCLSISYAEDKPEIFVQMGHSDEINSVAFSPDGRFVLSGSNDNTVKLWDVSTGREVRTFQGHSGFVNSVAFSPDGKYALSGSLDKTIKLWEVSTGREVRTFQGHSDSVTSIAFSPDGKYVLSGGGDIKLWEVSTGTRVRRVFWGQTWGVKSVTFSPDGRYALSGGQEGIKLWDVSTGKEVRRFGGPSSSVAFSPDGRYALSGSNDKTVKLWDVSTGKEVRTFPGHSDWVNSVAFSPDGRYVLSAGGGDIKLWELSTGSEVRTLKGASPVAFSPDGRYALWGGDRGKDPFDKTIRLCDLSTGKEVRRFQGHSDKVISVAFSPDGQYALSGGWDKTLKFWDLSTGRGVRSIKGHPGWVNSVAFSPDSKYALSGSSVNEYALSGGRDTIKLWEVSTGREVRRFMGHPGDVYSVAFTPDGRYVLSGGGNISRGNNSNTLKLWEVSTGKEVRTFQGESDAVKSVAFSSDGRHAFSATGYIIKLWEVSTGREVRSFRGGHYFTAAALSPDGRYVLSAGEEDYSVKLWDVSTGREARTFHGHSWWVTSIAFSSDGRYALSGGWDNTVKLWEVSTGKEIRTFHGHSDRVESVAFSFDGRYMLSGGEGGATRIWNTATGREICTMVGFKDSEWVVITPEGYFNASKDGPAHLNIRMGNRVFGLDQFYDVFYRPDIVEAKLKGEDITALASTNLEDALKNPPPGVEFISVPSESSDNKVTIKYKIKSTGGGIGEVRLFHNGKLIQSDGFYRQAKTAPAGKATLLAYNTRAIKDELRSVAIVAKKDKKLSLIESTPKGDTYEGAIIVDAISGENDISIAAFNRNNTVQSILKTATFKSTLKPDDSHLYVLSVGIDEYNSTRDNLKYAVKDAENIAQKIKEQSVTQYKPENIHIITLENKEASKTNIINKITGLSQTIKPIDVFVLFIASHGVLQSGLYSIVTHDYDGNLSNSNLINSNEIMDISKNMKALTQIFILDTCHAGGLDNFVSGLYDARMTVLARNMGLHMFASASSTQEALDGYKGKNGMFTYTLLEGLNNNRNTDTNKDNKVSIYELGSYAKEQTVNYSKETNHSQTPVINNFGKDITVYVIR